MEQKVDTKKNVFNKAQYPKTIDTSFKELGVTTISNELENQTTVADFFVLYNNLFYDIPPNGATNSHEYIVQQSGDYINYDQYSEEIAALQEEIASLREELLNSQIQIAEISQGITTGSAA